jgi:hypothetical protein
MEEVGETQQPQDNKALHPTAYSSARSSLRLQRRVSLVVVLRRAALTCVILIRVRKMNRKVLLLFVPPLIIPAALLMRRPEPACSNRVEVSIGNYSSRAAGQAASLNQLAYELKRCPHAQSFSILRNNGGINSWLEEKHEQTFYDRKKGFLQDGAPLYGANTQWQNVKEQAIYKVASTSGNFNDFAKYGGKYSMP